MSSRTCYQYEFMNCNTTLSLSQRPADLRQELHIHIVNPDLQADSTNLSCTKSLLIFRIKPLDLQALNPELDNRVTCNSVMIATLSSFDHYVSWPQKAQLQVRRLVSYFTIYTVRVHVRVTSTNSRTVTVIVLLLIFSSITLLTCLLLIIINNFRASLIRYSAALIDVKLSVTVRVTDLTVNTLIVVFFVVVTLVISSNCDSINLLFVSDSSLLLLLLQSFLNVF